MMHVYIKLELPFCLYLKDDLYKLTVPELGTTDEISVVLEKFRREKEKIDYVTFWGAELVERGELWNDPRGTFRRTSAIVILPASVEQAPLDPNPREYQDRVIRIIEAAVKTLNRLITIYKYITEDTYIPTIGTEDVYNTFEIGNCIFRPDNTIQYKGIQGGFDNRLTNTQPNYDEAIHEQIKQWLASDNLLPLFEEFMINTHFQLQERNWRAVIIEVQTAFEIFVSHTIRQFYLGQGYTVSRINNIMKCGLANLIADHLPKAIAKNFASGQSDYDKWQCDTYLMRNRVVHEGYTPSEQEAIDAVLGVENALTYLVDRPKQKFWLKPKPPTVVNEFITS